MKTATLANIRTQVRERCDIENSEFITDSELNSYINLSYADLYDKLVSAFEDYYLTSTTSTVSAGSSSFSVPNDFYKLKAVDYQLSDGNFVSLNKFNFSERNNKYNNTGSLNNNYNIRYRLVGNTIELIPTNQATGTYKIWYVPVYTTLSSDSDTLDGVNGWEEYIIVDACIKCLTKEESDTSEFQRQKQYQLKRLEEMKINRDIGQPDTITDIHNQLYDDWFRY